MKWFRLSQDWVTVYEVYAVIKDVPGYGYRTTKVEIECISDEEIMHYEKEQSDRVMEVVY